MKWYMTVGYPGGEFAFTDPQKLMRHIGFKLGDYAGPLIQINDDGHVRSVSAVPCVRLCPPDLVEWLEADPGLGVHHHNSDSIRFKRPGGWLETVFFSNQQNIEMVACSSIFIPVPGTANITVLEDMDA